MGAALRARALLEQHELAALEVAPGSDSTVSDLEREVDVAVEVLVQRVPVALAVAQDQRRRALLAGGAAALEQLARASGGKRRRSPPQALRPVVGDRREVAVEAPRSSPIGSGSGWSK